ncbi:unnamed protein product [Moneuplotes crassus]|uniref:Uncharacterized protein n=1 Tax=Euplotes crassus TaxID=5936 RepID=A0AAD1UCP8_EUPCR|nr:unnamed protein product [Moneuplotes crassus]
MKLGKKLIVFKPKVSKTYLAQPEVEIEASNDENKCDRNLNNTTTSGDRKRSSKIIRIKKKNQLVLRDPKFEKNFWSNDKCPEKDKKNLKELSSSALENLQHTISPKGLKATSKKFRPGRLLRRGTRSFQSIPKNILSPTLETIQEYPQEIFSDSQGHKFPIPKFQALEKTANKRYSNQCDLLHSPHLKFQEEKKMEILSKYCNTESEGETDSTKESDLKSSYIRKNSIKRKPNAPPAPRPVPSTKALKMIMNKTIRDVSRYKKKIFNKNRTIPCRSAQSLPRLPNLS